jgi:PIN domain nuclease of toxin-antitoxin system
MADSEAVYVSAASIWEIAIKAQLGKLEGDPLALAEAIEASGFHALAVTTRHEPLHLLTADRQLAAYGGGITTL